MKKLIYITLLLLIFVGCSGGKSTSSSDDDIQVSSSNQSSSSTTSQVDVSSSAIKAPDINVGVVPPMNEVTPPVTKRSPISLYKVGGASLNKKLTSVEAMSPLAYDINLDTIAMTSGFQFLLRNSGTSTIKGLKFKSNLPYFKVTPDTIVTLSVPNVATGMEQLIKVTVEHGTNASGLGYADVLTGDQYGTITISGKNADGDFSVSYVMHVYAKRMVLYINHPDTIWSLDPDLAGFVSSDAYFAKNNDYGTSPYVYADEHTNDCYVNYVQDKILIDNTSNVNFYSDRMTKDASGNDRTDNADLVKLLQFEKRLYYKLYSLTYMNIVPSNSPPDMNCVVLVVNKDDNTEFILQ